MARFHQISRRQATFDDSDSDDDAANASIDPKIAIQIADLSNTARDRQTAHDREPDRVVNLAAINRGRKCNQEGTEEATNAAAYQKQLKGWNSFGGDDTTTNLDDIAGGQYHRLTTAQKVQADIRHLRISGKEVNAESIDDFQNRSARRDGPASIVQKPGRTQHNGFAENRSKPLDPAVDPNREYRYKNGPQYGSNQSQSPRGLGANRAGRGGRGAGRGGHSTQVGRGSLILSGDARNAADTVVSVEPSRGKGMGSRAAIQRRVQERPWPPAALMGNPEPLPLSIVAPPVGLAQDNTKVEEDKKQVVPQQMSAPVEVEAAPIHQSQSVPELKVEPALQSPPKSLSEDVQQKEPPRNTVRLAEDFGNWFSSTPFAQTVKVPQLSQPATQPTAPVSLNEKMDLLQEGLRRQSITEEHRTDGRLTPVTWTEDFGEEQLLAAPTTAVSSGDSKPLAAVAGDNKVSSGIAQVLIDADIPEEEQMALEVVSRSTSRPRSSFSLSEDDRSRTNFSETAAPRPQSPSKATSQRLNASKWATPTTTLLGDCSNLPRRASGLDVPRRGGLSESRFAQDDPEVKRVNFRKYVPAGPGYEQLLRDLQLR